MARKRYIETHSNYTLKRLHQTTSKGHVFESDLMTITEPRGFAPGQMPIFSDSNFKLSVRKGVNNKIKHESNTWITENIEEGLSNITSTNNNLIIKPNSSDLFEFACYGSAVELIKSSISHIILNFPGEIFLSQEQYMIFKNDDSTEKKPLGGKDKFIVKNPFGINLISKVTPKTYSKINSLRYFCESWKDYRFYATVENLYCPSQSIGEEIRWYVDEKKPLKCAKDEDLVAIVKLGICDIFYYYYNGSLILLHNYNGTGHIRPKETLIEEFFNSLDDFEKVLLNRKTNYTWYLNTPRETDRGIFTSLRAYRWPVCDDWNIDFTSQAFQTYLNSLIDVGEFYDKYYSDNVVASMTHEALKNFDWTHIKETDDSTTTYEGPNSFKLEAILRTYGRQLDNIRLYAKSIKHTANISYSAQGDTPDYLLKKKLELGGWGVKTPLSGAADIYTTQKIYPTDTLGYSVQDANNLFLRLLKLNSNAILNAKGTKRSIEMLFALFGYHSIDFIQKRLYRDANNNVLHWDDLPQSEQRKMYKSTFTMNEYIGVAYNKTVPTNPFYGYIKCDNQLTRKINAKKDDYTIEYGDFNSVDEIELQGLPVKPVTITLDNGELVTYLVPWYDKNMTYNTYYQGKGGWGKSQVKYDTIPTFGEITINSDDENGFSIYEETEKYLHFALNLDALLSTPYSNLSNGDIYYVSDITGLNQKYNGYVESYNDELISDGEYIDVESVSTRDALSHYFILKDIEYCNVLGQDNGGNWGWKNITQYEILQQKSIDGKKVLYLETIKNNTKENNPHTGKGSYDNGEDYIKHFEQLFIDDTFDDANDSEIEGYENIGFDIEIQTDNARCWYFTNTSSEKNKILELELKNANEFISYEDEEITFDDTARLRGTQFTPYNMENEGVNYDEAAANSVINLKRFELNFFPTILPNNTQFGFINDVMMYYAKQLIPSTSILSHNIPDSWSKTAEICNITSDVKNNTSSIASTQILNVADRDENDASENLYITLKPKGNWSVDVGNENWVNETPINNNTTTRQNVPTGITMTTVSVTPTADWTVDFESEEYSLDEVLPDIVTGTTMTNVPLSYDGDWIVEEYEELESED